MKNIYFIIISLFILIYVIYEVRKKRFSIKESFWWVFGSILALILAVFPYSIDKLAEFLNIAYPPSVFFVLCIIFLLFINFRNSKKIAEQQLKIIELAQNLAILESNISTKRKEK